MGLYDTIEIWMKCPYCGKEGVFDAQTKDLGSSMFDYHALSPDWKKHPLEKKFRKGFPMSQNFPEDKSFTVWKDQAEYREAKATVPKEYKKSKYVEVIATCNSVKCQFDSDRDWILVQGSPSGFGRGFEGKIRIKDGKLVEPIYDIKKDGLTEKKLSTYKTKYKKKFNRLMKKYKHEPIVCRMWNKEG